MEIIEFLGWFAVVAVLGGSIAIALYQWRIRREAKKLSQLEGVSPLAVSVLSGTWRGKGLSPQDELMMRVMSLFHAVDPRGSTEQYNRLVPSVAQEVARAIFDELDEIIEESYGTQVFPEMRLLIKTEADIAHGALYLQGGDRERFVDFLYDRLRACGVDQEFCDEALGMYANFFDEDDEVAPDQVM